MTTDTLTPREREVMRLRSLGLGPGEIGARLGITADTARKHRDNAVRRTGLGSEIAVVLELERSTATA